MERTPQQITAAYVAPFAVFIGFLALQSVFPVPQWARFGIEAVLIAALSRSILRQPPSRPLASVGVGVLVFIIWVGPDLVFPGYRESIIFSNAVLGHYVAHPAVPRGSSLFMVFRVLNSVLAIPILEELFWRGWLMRWLIDRKFWRVSLGTYSAEAFWIVAALFASEHGAFWDVGLIAGVIYNYWIVRTRNLNDCIIAHAVTNACLAAFVMGAGQWQYWL